MDIKPKNLLKRVLQFARDELERRARPHEDEAARAPDSQAESASSPALGAAPSVADDVGTPAVTVQGLEVVRPPEGGLLRLRWAITEAEVARARTLISGNPVLCVRLVSFSKARDDVLRDVQDRPGVDLQGQCEIGEPQQRAVVALGLRAGDRFVSIAHHVI